MTAAQSDMGFEALTFHREGAVAIITLNRPKAANGLNAQMGLELRRAAKFCDSSDDIRAVIITGSGRFFCAGGDVKEMFDQGDAVGSAIKNLADDLHMAISTLSRMKKPVIIALNVNQTALRLRGLWWSIMAFATIARLKFCQKRG